MVIQSRVGQRVRVILVVIIMFTVLRLALPDLVTGHINNSLRELPGYRGEIRDVSLHLLRGSYRIDSLKIFKLNGNAKIPLVAIPTADLSIEWMALLQGKIVGKVELEMPTLNFIEGNIENSTNEQSGFDINWARVARKLMPLPVNRITISRGRVVFHDFSAEPHVDLFLHDVQVEAENLHADKTENNQLPSSVSVTARSIGNGKLRMTMKINTAKKIPDLDMSIKVENLDLRALNDFFAAYAKVDVEMGNFNLYSEVAVHAGEVDGYINPLFSNVKAASDEIQNRRRPLKLVWEVFENSSKSQLSAHVPVQGRILSGAPFWPVLWNIFRNAFVKAFETKPGLTNPMPIRTWRFPK